MSLATVDLDATFFDAIDLLVDLDDKREMRGRDCPSGRANLFTRDFQRHLICGVELELVLYFCDLMRCHSISRI